MQRKNVKSGLRDCKKNGVCQALMRLDEEWKNYPREEEDFYDTREVTVQIETDPDIMTETTVEASCITMTSMLFCKHGGIIMPVYSGQELSAHALEPLPRVTRVSDRLGTCNGSR